MSILSRIEGPRDLKSLSYAELEELSQDCREIIIQTITKTASSTAPKTGSCGTPPTSATPISW